MQAEAPPLREDLCLLGFKLSLPFRWNAGAAQEKIAFLTGQRS